jgi:hypothetical protein
MCFRAKIMFEIFLRSYSRIFEDTDTGYLSQSEGKSTHNWVTERLHFYNINARQRNRSSLFLTLLQKSYLHTHGTHCTQR